MITGYVLIWVGYALVIIGMVTIIWGIIEDGLKQHPVEVIDEQDND